MTGYTTRAEHIAKIRQRALESFDADGPEWALTALTCDLTDHPETATKCPFVDAMITLLQRGLITDVSVRAYIEGLR
jgi:hypothetical protein